MGCTQSKIENEETVNRCKERRQHMERAVTARNKFAAAHSAHAMSLKNTGAALSDFAQGEVAYPSAAAAAAAASVASSSSAAATAVAANPPPPLPPYDNFPPPPPPLPASFTNSSPLQRAATMPEFGIPLPETKHSDPIIEEEESEEEIEAESSHSLKRRSTSSKGGGRGGVPTPEVVEDEVLHHLPRRKSNSRDPEPLQQQQQHRPPPPPENSSWDYFFSMENVPGPTLAEVDDNNLEREENERKVFQERSKKVEMNGKSEKVEKVEEEVVETAKELPPQPPPPPEAAMAAAKTVKRVKQGAPAEFKKKGVGSNVNLMQIFVDLDDCFLKSSQSAHDVSRMLEATRLHYHSNFADKRGNINHSQRVMRVITWNRSFRGLSNNDDGLDDFDSEEHETHATVLDKMLAWEKKLYDEVKAGEQMKHEYQKKVASLNKLKKRNSNTEALEKMKATVSHLHTRYIVDMQSMDSTVSEINRLRDEQLYPKLVALVDGMATMWETIQTQHENKSKIVQALRHLDISQSPKETTDHHHERTRQLCGVVQEWHSNFTELMSQQKEYIKALNTWLKLNLIPIDTNWKEKVSSPARAHTPPIQALLHGWHDYLEKLPDEPARASVNNFAAIVKTIWQYQKEELELRAKCAESRKELGKKTREFENWANKYMQKRAGMDEAGPDGVRDEELVTEKRMAVEAAKQKVEEDEEAYQKLCVQVREKSLMSLKSHLPELFRALSDFALACSDMYGYLRSITHLRARNEA